MNLDKILLTLGEDGRILSAGYVNPEAVTAEAVLVDELPGSPVTDYRYVDGQYIHDPLPAPDVEDGPEPVTMEARVAALEAAMLELGEVMANG